MVFLTSSARDKGFTLLELLVGLVLMALLSALAVPNVGTWINQYRVKKVSRQIVSDMQLAKMKCISERIQYKVALGSSSYTIEKGNKSIASTTYTQILQRTLSDPASPYYAKGVSMSIDNVVFSPSGSASPSTITVSEAGGYTKTVTVSIAGRIRLD